MGQGTDLPRLPGQAVLEDSQSTPGGRNGTEVHMLRFPVAGLPIALNLAVSLLFGPSFLRMKHFVSNAVCKHQARLETQEGHQGPTTPGKGLCLSTVTRLSLSNNASRTQWTPLPLPLTGPEHMCCWVISFLQQFLTGFWSPADSLTHCPHLVDSL